MISPFYLKQFTKSSSSFMCFGYKSKGCCLMLSFFF